MNNSVDFALRLCESVAFTLHGILGLTEPFTGCLRSTFQDNGAMPPWFWPTAGTVLLLIAAVNLRFSSSDDIILAVQAYIAAFHMGGMLYHLQLGHHPASTVGPGTFVVLAVAVAMLRGAVWMVALGLLGCAGVAVGLSRILVTPPSGEGGSQGDRLLGADL